MTRSGSLPAATTPAPQPPPAPPSPSTGPVGREQFEQLTRAIDELSRRVITKTRWAELMDEDDAAAYLGMGTRTLRRLRSEGVIKPVTSRGSVRYPRTRLDEYIASLKDGGGKFRGVQSQDVRKGKGGK
ncbi:MAG: helix-turn-helix domain-containing protein [Planctomycetota bacterium]